MNENGCRYKLKCRNYVHRCNEKSCILALNEMLKEKDSEIEELKERIALPCRVDDDIHYIDTRHTKCSHYGVEYDEYECCGCECACDSEPHKEIVCVTVPNDKEDSTRLSKERNYEY